jgi:hypothetical protein
LIVVGTAPSAACCVKTCKNLNDTTQATLIRSPDSGKVSTRLRQ